MGTCQKLDIILENFNFSNRKCGPKLIFFNEKKEKDSDDF